MKIDFLSAHFFMVDMSAKTLETDEKNMSFEDRVTKENSWICSIWKKLQRMSKQEQDTFLGNCWDELTYTRSSDNSFYDTTPSRLYCFNETYRKRDKDKWEMAALMAVQKDYKTTIAYHVGDIMKMTCWRLCEAKRTVAEATAAKKRAEELQRREKEKHLQAMYAANRQRKEEEQYYDLAAKYPESFNGVMRPSGMNDREWGIKCFTIRMRKDQHKKNTTEKEVSENYLKKFLEWLKKNPNWDDMGKDIADNYSYFCHYDWLRDYRNTTNNFKYPARVMKDLFFQLFEEDPPLRDTGAKPSQMAYSFETFVRPILSRDSKLLWSQFREKLHVKIRISWPEKTSTGFNYPIQGQLTETYGWVKLQGNTRYASPNAVFHVAGCIILNEQTPVLITTGSQICFKLVPEEFSKCQNMTKPKSQTFQICHKLPQNFEIKEICISSGHEIDDVNSYARTLYSPASQAEEARQIIIRGREMSDVAFRDWEQQNQAPLGVEWNNFDIRESARVAIKDWATFTWRTIFTSLKKEDLVQKAVEQRIQDKKAARVAKIQEYRKSRLAKIQEYRESNKQLQVNTKPKVGFDWKKTLQDLKTSYDEGLITESDWEAAKSRILEKSF